MHQPTYPESFDDVTVKQWIQAYYSTVDTDGAVETIADFFTHDAVVQMGEHGVSDRPGLIRLFASTWDYVASRSHYVASVNPLGNNTFLARGTVTYNLKDGRSVTPEWCGIMGLLKQEGEWKMAYYKVYFAAFPAF
ncbi:uncharacterized protein BO97DRAFT_444415 [Aspergillus homomorphus CBS 101889]|uniref:SnoaL-like domain-containing protein n=1 Tax=Aspergillus homomorphus (strain CBS 101889) TaxID=1450537 RepID=A0A395HS83_ASPHC|nr:hypothetical protein BO97DRAFT_444415 [Aspergillus homomorphus CBS 101889]RAL10677.1 hypothetical protein BO97DRAFT_444415 [Aspergillus homomorphus CBS 101889]